MPEYLYRSAKGAEFTVFHEMAHAPPVGHERRREGELFKRVPSFQARTPATRHFKSWSLPPWYPYHNRYDRDGQPVFDSMNEVRECEAKARDGGDHLAYD